MIRMVKTYWQQGVPEYVQGREYDSGPLPRGFNTFNEFAAFLVKRGDAEPVRHDPPVHPEAQPVRKKKRRKR